MDVRQKAYQTVTKLNRICLIKDHMEESGENEMVVHNDIGVALQQLGVLSDLSKLDIDSICSTQIVEKG